MKTCVFMLLCSMAFATIAIAHPGHHHPEKGSKGNSATKTPAVVDPGDGDALVLADVPVIQLPPKSEDGQGAWRFKYVPELSNVPVPPAVLLKAHGGFGANKLVKNDVRETYFGLPGAGLLRISPDLKKVEVIGGGPGLKTGANFHNAHVFRHLDATRIALPSNDAGKVFITDTQGVVVNELLVPGHVDPKVWKPTDVAELDGVLYVANGYGDRIIYNADPLEEWLGGQWGGKPLFSTSHGLSTIPGTRFLRVADRENGRLIDFDTAGKERGRFYLEANPQRNEAALKGEPAPCDVDFTDDGKYAVVGCLKGPGGGNAVFYIMEGGKVLSKVCPADLGVANSRHIHNAAFRVIPQADGTEKWYVLCLFWSPGGYAVFERL